MRVSEDLSLPLSLDKERETKGVLVNQSAFIVGGIGCGDTGSV